MYILFGFRDKHKEFHANMFVIVLALVLLGTYLYLLDMMKVFLFSVFSAQKTESSCTKEVRWKTSSAGMISILH